MNCDDALRLVHQEALGENSIVVAARMGEEIDPHRVDHITAALRAVFDHVRGAQALDRRLGYALVLLVTEVPYQLQSWEPHRQVSQALADALLRLRMAVESIFCDVWTE